MGLIIDIRNCDCCGGHHEGIDLYAPPVPPQFRVYGNFGRDCLWYLCPTFLFAVIVTRKSWS